MFERCNDASHMCSEHKCISLKCDRSSLRSEFSNLVNVLLIFELYSRMVHSSRSDLPLLRFLFDLLLMPPYHQLSLLFLSGWCSSWGLRLSCAPSFPCVSQLFYLVANRFYMYFYWIEVTNALIYFIYVYRFQFWHVQNIISYLVSSWLISLTVIWTPFCFKSQFPVIVFLHLKFIARSLI